MIFKAVNITKISKIAIYFQTENTKCKKFQSKKKNNFDNRTSIV